MTKEMVYKKNRQSTCPSVTSLWYSVLVSFFKIFLTLLLNYLKMTKQRNVISNGIIIIKVVAAATRKHIKVGNKLD